MPRIPTNPGDLPSSQDRFEPLDETLTYDGEVELLQDGIDKNTHPYIKVRIRVLEPEAYAGRIVYDNYVALPWTASKNADSDELKRAHRSGDRLGDLARSAGVTGSRDGWDTDELLGCTVRFTIRNEEYLGRVNSKPNSYLLR